MDLIERIASPDQGIPDEGIEYADTAASRVDRRVPRQARHSVAACATRDTISIYPRPNVFDAMTYNACRMPRSLVELV